MASTVKCGTHGEVEPRFLCDHLWVKERTPAAAPMKYFLPHMEPGDSIPSIWCADCEMVIMREGGFTDVALDYVKFHMVCEFCFQKYLVNNVAAGA